eukprot:RCo006447
MAAAFPSQFQGVLLCTRPSAASKSSAPPAAAAPFLAGRAGVSSGFGLQPSKERTEALREAKSAVVHPRKEVAALSQHRRWLREQERAREEQRTSELEEAGQRETKEAAFREHMAELRRKLLEEQRREHEESPVEVAAASEVRGA